jgi:carbonic anhydrase
VRDAWQRKQPLTLHGWIYGIKDGLLRDLKMTVERPDELAVLYKSSIVSS